METIDSKCRGYDELEDDDDDDDTMWSILQPIGALKPLKAAPVVTEKNKSTYFDTNIFQCPEDINEPSTQAIHHQYLSVENGTATKIATADNSRSDISMEFGLNQSPSSSNRKIASLIALFDKNPERSKEISQTSDGNKKQFRRRSDREWLEFSSYSSDSRHTYPPFSSRLQSSPTMILKLEQQFDSPLQPATVPSILEPQNINASFAASPEKKEFSLLNQITRDHMDVVSNNVFLDDAKCCTTDSKNDLGMDMVSNIFNFPEDKKTEANVHSLQSIQRQGPEIRLGNGLKTDMSTANLSSQQMRYPNIDCTSEDVTFASERSTRDGSAWEKKSIDATTDTELTSTNDDSDRGIRYDGRAFDTCSDVMSDFTDSTARIEYDCAADDRRAQTIRALRRRKLDLARQMKEDARRLREEEEALLRSPRGSAIKQEILKETRALHKALRYRVEMDKIEEAKRELEQFRQERKVLEQQRKTEEWDSSKIANKDKNKDKEHEAGKGKVKGSWMTSNVEKSNNGNNESVQGQSYENGNVEESSSWMDFSAIGSIFGWGSQQISHVFEGNITENRNHQNSRSNSKATPGKAPYKPSPLDDDYYESLLTQAQPHSSPVPGPYQLTGAISRKPADTPLLRCGASSGGNNAPTSKQYTSSTSSLSPSTLLSPRASAPIRTPTRNIRRVPMTSMPTPTPMPTLKSMPKSMPTPTPMPTLKSMPKFMPTPTPTPMTMPTATAAAVVSQISPQSPVPLTLCTPTTHTSTLRVGSDQPLEQSAEPPVMLKNGAQTPLRAETNIFIPSPPAGCEALNPAPIAIPGTGRSPSTERVLLSQMTYSECISPANESYFSASTTSRITQLQTQSQMPLQPQSQPQSQPESQPQSQADKGSDIVFTAPSAEKTSSAAGSPARTTSKPLSGKPIPVNARVRQSITTSPSLPAHAAVAVAGAGADFGGSATKGSLLTNSVQSRGVGTRTIPNNDPVVTSPHMSKSQTSSPLKPVASTTSSSAKSIVSPSAGDVATKQEQQLPLSSLAAASNARKTAPTTSSSAAAPTSSTTAPTAAARILTKPYITTPRATTSPAPAPGPASTSSSSSKWRKSFRSKDTPTAPGDGSSSPAAESSLSRFVAFFSSPTNIFSSSTNPRSKSKVRRDGDGASSAGGGISDGISVGSAGIVGIISGGEDERTSAGNPTTRNEMSRRAVDAFDRLSTNEAADGGANSPDKFISTPTTGAAGGSATAIHSSVTPQSQSPLMTHDVWKYVESMPASPISPSPSSPSYSSYHTPSSAKQVVATNLEADSHRPGQMTSPTTAHLPSASSNRGNESVQSSSATTGQRASTPRSSTPSPSPSHPHTHTPDLAAAATSGAIASQHSSQASSMSMGMFTTFFSFVSASTDSTASQPTADPHRPTSTTEYSSPPASSSSVRSAKGSTAGSSAKPFSGSVKGSAKSKPATSQKPRWLF